MAKCISENFEMINEKGGPVEKGVQERKLYCGTFQNDSVMVDKHTQLW